MKIHIFDVGMGNMTLLRFPNGTTFLNDCNVTENNESEVLAYLDKAMLGRKSIEVFICSHRYADHMRGIRKVHEQYQIGKIRDPGVAGTTTAIPEYEEYMNLSREIGFGLFEARTYLDIGEATLRFMNSKDDEDGMVDSNDQSIVLMVVYKGSSLPSVRLSFDGAPAAVPQLY